MEKDFTKGHRTNYDYPRDTVLLGVVRASSLQLRTQEADQNHEPWAKYGHVGKEKGLYKQNLHNKT
jgi:hypothetical protein